MPCYPAQQSAAKKSPFQTPATPFIPAVSEPKSQASANSSKTVQSPISCGSLICHSLVAFRIIPASASPSISSVHFTTPYFLACICVLVLLESSPARNFGGGVSISSLRSADGRISLAILAIFLALSLTSRKYRIASSVCCLAFSTASSASLTKISVSLKPWSRVMH